MGWGLHNSLPECTRVSHIGKGHGVGIVPELSVSRRVTRGCDSVMFHVCTEICVGSVRIQADTSRRDRVVVKFLRIPIVFISCSIICHLPQFIINPPIYRSLKFADPSWLLEAPYDYDLKSDLPHLPSMSSFC